MSKKKRIKLLDTGPNSCAAEIDFSDLAPTDCVSVDSVNQWETHGVRCHYARFHQPVPPYVNKEPVSEFKLTSIQDKYKVDSIVYTPHGLMWTANGETNIAPLANVIYVRTIK